MFVFILLSLALGYLVQSGHPLVDQLVAPFFLYLGVGGALLAIVGALVNKARLRIWYDVCASGLLFTWFAYWKTVFNVDSPMFFFFPIYFVAMGVFVSLAFVSQCDRLDPQSVSYMRRFAEKGLQPWLVMLGALGSLQLLEHYLVFPIMMTLLLLRYALDCCIERNAGRDG